MKTFPKKVSKSKYMIKVKHKTGWLYLDNRFSDTGEALNFAKRYSKQWHTKTKVVFFEPADKYTIREVEVH